MSLNLSPEYKEKVARILHAFVPEEKIVAFGSRVTGKAGKFSDLDLCIMNQERLNRATVAELRSVFDASFLPFEVDVVEWTCIGDAFKKAINEGHEIIQEAGQTIPLEKSTEQGSHAQT
jgi:uncharacterized protein